MRESDRRMWSASMTVALTLPCSTALMPVGSSSEDLVQQRHPDVEAVARLPEVGGARVAVELGRNLVDPRQRVHDDGVLAQVRHGLAVDPVDAFDRQVGGLVAEPLLL